MAQRRHMALAAAEKWPAQLSVCSGESAKRISAIRRSAGAQYHPAANSSKVMALYLAESMAKRRKINESVMAISNSNGS